MTVVTANSRASSNVPSVASAPDIALQLDCVTKSFGRKRVLDGVSFSVPKGTGRGDESVKVSVTSSELVVRPQQKSLLQPRMGHGVPGAMEPTEFIGAG